jgi:hypothetical protein
MDCRCRSGCRCAFIVYLQGRPRDPPISVLGPTGRWPWPLPFLAAGEGGAMQPIGDRLLAGNKQQTANSDSDSELLPQPGLGWGPVGGWGRAPPSQFAAAPSLARPRPGPPPLGPGPGGGAGAAGAARLPLAPVAAVRWPFAVVLCWPFGGARAPRGQLHAAWPGASLPVS